MAGASDVAGRPSYEELDAAAAPTQYGPGIRALGVYLVVFQHLPYDRACQVLRDLAGAAVSTGTLTGWVTWAAGGLTDFDERLRELLAGAEVCHFDETGARIAGRLGWVHSASTATLTRYTTHARRGCEAIDDAGVLPDFNGVAVHDGWAPYRNYQGCQHGLCNVHHLRELQGACEVGHTWPVAMSCLLLDTKDLVERSCAAGRDRLDAGALADLATSYQTIIAMGHDEHPATTAKKTKAHNLLLRLERYQPDVLRFAHASACRSGTTRPSRTSAWSSCSRRSPAAGARRPAPNASSQFAATSPPPASTATAPSTSSAN